MNSFYIGKYAIEPGGKPFVVAELSGNHNKSIDRAMELIDLAVDAGAHAVKLQTYTADSLTIDHDGPGFIVSKDSKLWKNRKLYELYQEANTPYEWHGKLFEYSKKKGILCFSTPFDEAAVDFLEQFDPPCYKIASFENNHYPLIEKVASTGKPIIISLGLSSLAEIEELNSFLISKKVKDYVLLKCCSVYPADPRYINLQTIPFLHNRLNVNIGLSDHTVGIGVAVASVALGCQVIEKHFTDSRAKGGIDSAFSMEPNELRALIAESEIAWQGIGKASFDLSDDEQKSLSYKRSIYVVKQINAGEVFTKENLRIIRPSFGLAPKNLNKILGKKATRDLSRGTPLVWDAVESLSNQNEKPSEPDIDVQLVAVDKYLQDQKYLTDHAKWRNESLAWTRENNLTDPKQQLNYLSNLKENERFFVILGKDGKPVGTTGLTSISKSHKTAEFSLLVGSEHRRNGYATKALKSILKYGFNELGLELIFGETFAYPEHSKKFLDDNLISYLERTDGLVNPGAKTYQNLGFKFDATLPNRYFKYSFHVNSLIYSITKQVFFLKNS